MTILSIRLLAQDDHPPTADDRKWTPGWRALFMVSAASACWVVPALLIYLLLS